MSTPDTPTNWEHKLDALLKETSEMPILRNQRRKLIDLIRAEKSLSERQGAERVAAYLKEMHAKLGKNCRRHPFGKSSCSGCSLNKRVRLELGRILGKSKARTQEVEE